MIMEPSLHLLPNAGDAMYYLAIVIACLCFTSLVAIVTDVQVRYNKRQIGDKTITTFTIKRKS